MENFSYCLALAKSGISSEQVQKVTVNFSDTFTCCLQLPARLPQSNNDNTFLSQAFLDKHKLQLLSSPVSLATGGDVTGQGGVVTLTSPALLKIKPRSLVIYMKFDAVNWKVSQCNNYYMHHYGKVIGVISNIEEFIV